MHVFLKTEYIFTWKRTFNEVENILYKDLSFFRIVILIANMNVEPDLAWKW